MTSATPESRTFASTRISESHDFLGFDCGVPELNRWLTRSALRADAMGTARTFVWLQWNMEVVAHFSLCPHQVRRDEVPPQLGHGAPDAIPAILLARLALSVSLHHQKLGGELLIDALARAVDGVRAVGGRLIVVDAISDEAGAFYKHFGFQSIPEAPHRLFRKASDVEAALRGSELGTPRHSK